MPDVTLIDFRVPVAADHGEPARILDGAPRTTVENHYADPTQQFFSGTWSSTAGRWEIRYTEHEFCHLLEGGVILTSADGQQWRFAPGDAWVIPAGFVGTWESVGNVRKRYAIFEARPAG